MGIRQVACQWLGFFFVRFFLFNGGKFKGLGLFGNFVPKFEGLFKYVFVLYLTFGTCFGACLCLCRSRDPVTCSYVGSVTCWAGCGGVREVPGLICRGSCFCDEVKIEIFQGKFKSVSECPYFLCKNIGCHCARHFG